ncbi:hypothetical protein Q4534_16905, partial [Cyclobacterium sp. 1_MG-2023]|uniref:hypothetical protein n=1 Tax=Cyclobacterium sp. 1_MG-2023 TaxID=3062681 RepID=UPI0026E410F6
EGINRFLNGVEGVGLTGTYSFGLDSDQPPERINRFLNEVEGVGLTGTYSFGFGSAQPPERINRFLNGLDGLLTLHGLMKPRVLLIIFHLTADYKDKE